MRTNQPYKVRAYRDLTTNNSLHYFNVLVEESDLLVGSDSILSDDAYNILYKYRSYINDYICLYPSFKELLVPAVTDHHAPAIVQSMIASSQICGVGPMASVAGAISEYVGLDLRQYSRNVIIENGGDIFCDTVFDVTVSVYAGTSPLSNRLSLIVKSQNTPCGICTSSGTIGHSRSFGRADAVCVIAPSSSLADAAATAIANRITDAASITKTISFGQSIPGLSGILIIVGNSMGVWGSIELAEQ